MSNMRCGKWIFVNKLVTHALSMLLQKPNITNHLRDTSCRKVKKSNGNIFNKYANKNKILKIIKSIYHNGKKYLKSKIILRSTKSYKTMIYLITNRKIMVLI